MEKITFIIHPDGQVEIQVRGVKGPVCVDITRPFEQALGQVVSDKKTGEYYEDPGVAAGVKVTK